MARIAVLLVLMAAEMLPALGQDEPPRVVSNPGFALPMEENPVAENPMRQVQSPRGPRASIPLPPPGSNDSAAAQDQAVRGPLITVTSSLAIVLGLFCGFVWLSRKAGGGKSSLLNNDLFTVLGSAAIDARHRAALVKCGDRVLLVALTQSGVTTLTEFTDPAEVSDLLVKAGGNAKATFSEAFRETGKDKTARGFIEPSAPPPRSLFSHGPQ